VEFTIEINYYFPINIPFWGGVGRGGESTKFVERKSWCTPFLPIIRKKEKRKGKKKLS